MLSYLQVQDGVLEAIGEIVGRMAELRTMAADVSKNTAALRTIPRVSGIAGSTQPNGRW